MLDFAESTSDSLLDEGVGGKQAESCRRAWEACLQILIPKILALKQLDEDLFRPFRFCHFPSTAFQEDLITLSRRWRELGLAGSCPYPGPGAGEMEEHEMAVKMIDFASHLQEKLTELLDTNADGWARADLWETTQMWQERVFREMVKALREPGANEDGVSEEELRRMWPFDVMW